MTDDNIPVLEDIVRPDETEQTAAPETPPVPPARLSARQLEEIVNDVATLLSNEINQQLGSLLLEFQTDLREQLPKRVRREMSKRLGGGATE